MNEHPIQGLMQTAMENIKGMVDVNTIVGDPVETPDGSVILPISKVAFGFAAGGSDFRVEEDEKINGAAAGSSAGAASVKMLPFGGGSGGGVSIRPIAFLVVGKEGVHIVPLDNQTHLFEKIIDATPGLIDKFQTMFQGSGQGAMPQSQMPQSQTPQSQMPPTQPNSTPPTQPLNQTVVKGETITINEASDNKKH
ncbi:GerW family sporulation protein [Paenibacillus wynnii]|uniref:GerW family sporulation protein n=1 Tax=Paenibacillus wynnii TaxID=268407 RepID=UPI0027939AB9|nr:GerW family sporulation protein [Paenibacillus wynnii]MDQ0194522.1 sporulation protein YtfJ [Paenibacillus wynnii]